MLTQYQTLKYLDIYYSIPSSFLSFLTTGLIHTTSLQQLRVTTKLPINEEIRTSINVISQINNLRELQVIFTLDHKSYSNCSWKENKQITTSLYYEQCGNWFIIIIDITYHSLFIVYLCIPCAHVLEPS